MRQPVEAFVKTFTVGGAGGLDVPVPVSERVEVEFVGDFGGSHGVWEILLVGKYKEDCVPKFILGKHPCKFLPSFSDTFTVVAVNHKDEALSVLEVVTPQRSNLVLATDIPDREGNVFILDSFDVEAWEAIKYRYNVNKQTLDTKLSVRGTCLYKQTNIPMLTSIYLSLYLFLSFLQQETKKRLEGKGGIRAKPRPLPFCSLPV